MGPGTSTHMVILSPGDVLSFPEGLDVYADGPVCLISGAGFGVHIAPCGEVQEALGASYPATRIWLCTAPLWRACRTWWIDSSAPGPGTGCLHPGLTHSKPGNLPGPSQGFPTRVADSPTPGGLDPHSLGAPCPSPCSYPRGLEVLRGVANLPRPGGSWFSH